MIIKMNKLFIKILFCVLVMVPMGGFSAASSGDISGILLKEGSPLPGFYVRLFDQQGVSTGVKTSLNGEFIFTNLVDGLYVIQVELPGFSTRAISVEIKNQQSVAMGNVDISKEEIKTAELFKILPSSEYTTEKSDFFWGNLSQSPISMSGISSMMLEDLYGDTAKEILSTGVSGMDSQSDAGETRAFVIRGNQSWTMSLDGIRFTPVWEFPVSLLFDLVDSVELFKGPAGVTGVGAVGGLLNLRRKQPVFDKVTGSIRYITSPKMFHKNRVTVDISGPIPLRGAAGRLATRWTIAYAEKVPVETPLKYNQSFLVSPSIKYITKGGSSVHADVILGISYPEKFKGSSAPAIYAKGTDFPTVNPVQFVGKDTTLFNMFWRAGVTYDQNSPKILVGDLSHQIFFRKQLSVVFCRQHNGKYFSASGGSTPFLNANKKLIPKGSDEEVEYVRMNMERRQTQNLQLATKIELGHALEAGFIKNTLRSGLQGEYIFEPSSASFRGSDGRKYIASHRIVPSSGSGDAVKWNLEPAALKYDEGFPYSLDAFPTGLEYQVPQDMSLGEDDPTPEFRNKPLPYHKTALVGMYLFDQVSIGKYADLSLGVRYDLALEFADSKVLRDGPKENFRLQQGVSAWLGAVGHLLQNKFWLRSVDVYTGGMAGWTPSLSGAAYTMHWFRYFRNWNLKGSQYNFQFDTGMRVVLKNMYYISSSVYVNSYLNKTAWGPARSETDPVCRTEGAIYEQSLRGCVYENYVNNGLELDFKGPVITGLYWGGNYTWTSIPKWVEDQLSGGKKSSKGIDTVTKGIFRAARHMGSVWLKYTLPVTKAKGLGGRVSFRVKTVKDGRTGDDLPVDYSPNLDLFYKTKFLDLDLSFNNFANQRRWVSVAPEVNTTFLSDGFDIRAGIRLKF